MKFFISVLFLAAAVLATAQDIKDDYDNFPADYDNFYDYDQLKEEGDKIEAELDKLEAENDLKVKEEIDKFREEINEDDDDVLDGIDEYQLEDNRDKSNEDMKEFPVDNNIAPDDNIDDAKKKLDDQADYALLWGDDSVAPLPVPEVESLPEDKAILEETQKILENDDDGTKLADEINQMLDDALELPDDKVDDAIVEETKQILEDTDESFNIDDENKTDGKTEKILAENDQSPSNVNDGLNNTSVTDEEPKLVIIDDIPIEKAVKSANDVEDKVEQDQEIDVNKSDNTSNVVHDVIEEEDTVDKVYADLNSDLDKLLETLDKLSDDGTMSDEKLEGVFDKLDDHFFKEDGDNVEGSEELVDDVKDDTGYSEVDFEKILDDIANESDFKEDNGESIDLNVELNDEMNELNPDDAFERDVESLPVLELNTTSTNNNTAVFDEQKNAESGEITRTIKEPSQLDANSNQLPDIYNYVPEGIDDKAVDIDTLDNDQLGDLMKQFSMTHTDILDVNSETFDHNIAPIYIKLKVDTPEVVNSPNYPNAYPTNNIVDWVFEGEGMGIELNITDLQVRGAMGDYLLVKPGGVDDSGHDGILFTYRLTSEKRFRFEDVDRMFVRFEARPIGMNNQRGFQFSAKMIAPIPDEPEPVPEPEAVLEPPTNLHTVFFAATVEQFQDYEEGFRQIIADMAAEYIRDNNIDPGLNTTAEVTQITSITHCPVTWPNFELCAAVTFGVQVTSGDEGDMLDEQALRDMWTTYSRRDPYALLLSRMGIEEFQQPRSSVLTAWLVIASGVLISMAMLAVVLWRFSCFEDYTRMKTYSDTDSLHNEKRGLDLYPTPHQTLPALYADNDLKWQDHEDSTRVDMGGFTNKNYARGMYDFESDEEAITPRDRYSSEV